MLVCPKCGRSSAAVPFFQAFCIHCYPFKLNIPPGFEFPACKDCERILFRGEWRRVGEKEMAEYVLGKCKGDFAEADYTVGDGIATFVLRAGSQEVRVDRSIPIMYPTALCPDCSKRRGGYFEAIIQLRGPQPRVKSMARRATAWFEKNSFIGKVDEPREGGVDLYVGSSKSAMEFAQSLGMHYTLTRKLFGEKEGKRIYRSTFAIRME